MMLTIFTPTYNRANLLFRLYQSLVSQSDLDFEWLIIDDGSTDNTKQIVQEMVEEKKILILYQRQENGGKHLAHNRAVKLARGEFFFCVDSDDMLAPEAVAAIKNSLGRLEEQDCGLVGGKQDIFGKQLCSGLRTGLPHAGLYSLAQCYGVRGELSLIFKTKLLKKNLFPTIPGEKFLGESVLYDALEMKGYTFCPILQNLTICEYQNNGLSNSAYRLLKNNPTGYVYYHMQRVNLVIRMSERIRHAIQYQAFRRLSKNKTYYYQGKHTWLVRGAYIPGYFASKYYRKKFQHTDNCVAT